MEILTKSPEETKEAGRSFSDNLTGGEVIALSGDLGAGKTTFLQGLAEGLGITKRVNSPTFIIMREYELRDDKNFYHIDLYRLEENIEKELENLGITDLWESDKNILGIEWAERAKDFLPEKTIWIKFENVSEEERKIIINR